MAHPDGVPSTNLWRAEFLYPDNLEKGLLDDYEMGGKALSDISEGRFYQVWHMTYDDEELSPTYGQVTVTPLSTGDPIVLFTITNIVNLGFTFDQLMREHMCYELENGNSYFYWYDTQLNDFTTTQLPAGSKSPRMCLDDFRTTQNDVNDIILGYIRDGSLYYRVQRERFDTEHLWRAGVGDGPLYTIGMQENLRVGYQLGSDLGVALCEIVADICDAVDVTDYDVSELCPIPVRGYLVAGVYSAADAIRSLQKVFFFDMPDIDAKLRGILRGQDEEWTIDLSDMVSGSGSDKFTYERAREQAIEFPRKLHLQYASAETDYVPTKQTSERRSPDVDWSRSEISVESAVNHPPDEAAQIAQVLHTVAWNEMEGHAKFGLDESWWRLAPSNPGFLEVYPGVYKRMRIVRTRFTEGVHEIEAVHDRKSSYDSVIAGSITLPPTSPQPTLPGDTTWEFMDLPALLTSHDSLHFYVAGRGDAGTGWRGYQVQRFIGADWQKAATVTFMETMGSIVEAVPAADGYYIDRRNTILVDIDTPDAASPESITQDDMFSGRGAWLIGDEIIQVRDWVQEGDNWRGSYLFRGRLNTSPGAHTIGERAVYLATPIRVPITTNLVDSDLTLRAVSIGESTATQADYTFTGRSQEEWPPEFLTWSKAGSDWTFNWIPRYPLGNSAGPIPHANFYGWVLRFTAGGVTVQRQVASRDPTFTYTSAMQVEDFGSNQSSFTTVEVRGLNYLGGEGQALTEASVS